jgi:hypothetical protein
MRGPTDGLGDGLTDPLPQDTQVLLRQAVLEHVAHERRRVHPPMLHVGVPGGPVASLAVVTAEPADHGLRTDVVAALRVRAGVRPTPMVWLTRTGGLELQDVDARWLAATCAAYDEAQAPLVFVVVNRRGWRDPRSELSRTWVRLRA